MEFYAGFASKEERMAYLVERDGNQCFICQLPFGKERPTIDHWIPLSKGGTWEITNLRLTHKRCNNWKGNMLPNKDGTIPERPVKGSKKRKVVKRSYGRRRSFHGISVRARSN